jgi:hypothetical protein
MRRSGGKIAAGSGGRIKTIKSKGVKQKDAASGGVDPAADGEEDINVRALMAPIEYHPTFADQVPLSP